MIIIVSGTPGTGKTTLSKKLAKELKFKYVDVNKIIKRFNLIESYDKARKTNVIDIYKLNRVLIKFIKQGKNLVIDGHLSHNLPKQYVDLAVITKCNLKKLEKRLERKRWSKSKIRENMDSEIFNICFEEAKQQKHKILVVDTTKRVDIDKLSRNIQKRIGKRAFHSLARMGKKSEIKSLNKIKKKKK